MKQVIQNYKTGAVTLKDVPVPLCKQNDVLVANKRSLISVGTEKSVIALGKQGLIGKARARPEQFKRAIERARNEGFLKVWKEAMLRLDDPKALGYSSAGVVIEAGEKVRSLSAGDRVACIGPDCAAHAEIISVPADRCAVIPSDMTFEEGAFGMLGIIALQGIHCAEVKKGEWVAVLGLGLLGQLTAQILKTYGCHVIGADICRDRIEETLRMGCDEAVVIDDMERAVTACTKGMGVDKIIITAASSDNSLILLSAAIARFRAKIILVGVIDIHIPRELFWDKELIFQVSKGGGYDARLERLYAYPPSYKQQSEAMNLAEIISLIAQKKINVASMITHRFSINAAKAAYSMLLGKGTKESYLGVVFTYDDVEMRQTTVQLNEQPIDESSLVRLGVIGAGLFGKSVLFPAITAIKDIACVGLATTRGNTAEHAAKRFGFSYCTTDYTKLLADQTINTVVILTRHNLHAGIVAEALQAGKKVFVEKPLATTPEELKNVWNVMKTHSLPVMVGFNRAYASLVQQVKMQIAQRHYPLMITMFINAGTASPDHWVYNDEGAGRIIGEVCHFVDLAQQLSGAQPVSVYTQRIAADNRQIHSLDNTSTVITMSDGSMCTIVYTSLGNRAYAREEIRICDNTTMHIINDFKVLTSYTKKGRRIQQLKSQDLGYKAEFKFFFEHCVHGGEACRLLYPSYVFTTLTTFALMRSLETGTPVAINAKEFGI